MKTSTQHCSLSIFARYPNLILLCIGFLSGGATQLNWLAQRDFGSFWARPDLSIRVLWGAIALPLFLIPVRAMIVKMIQRSSLPENIREEYAKRDVISYAVLLLTLAGSIGLRFSAPVVALMLASFLVLQGRALLQGRQIGNINQGAIVSSLSDSSQIGHLSILFFVSGFAALIYQVAWQRALFANFGVNIESTTIVVSLFMFGLGVGSLFGGFLSLLNRELMIKLFLACEVVIGLFGLVSLPLIKHVGQWNLHGTLTDVSIAIFGVLLIPTLFMGATLPILVSYLHQQLTNVGRLVGVLYFVNTLGSAVACFLTVNVLFPILGLSGAVLFAAFCNFAVAGAVFLFLTKPNFFESKRSMAKENSL